MRVLVCMMLGASTLLLGCTSKEAPAKQAVAAAETALNQVKPDAEKYAPEHLQTAEADLDSIKGALAKKDYQAVLSSVPRLNEEVKTVQDAVVSKQTQLAAATHEWEDLSEEVPKLVDAIQARVDTLSKNRLPKEVKKESFEAAKMELESMKAVWAEADAAFKAGNATEAADKARQVQAKAKEVSQQLAMSPV